MASKEERDNFFCLSLLLYRVGNQRLREYFKAQWPIVYQRVRPGTVPPPWQDTPHDATEMKKIQPTKLKFKFKDEETKFDSGNTNDWDFSLLATVLRYSSLNFLLPSSPESKALDDLKAIRNALIGRPTDAAIPNAVFNAAWTDACNALKLFNATAADFKSVQDDMKKPLDVLYPVLQQWVAQEKDIPPSTELQQTVEELQEAVEMIKRKDDTIPTEILARGPEALKAYEQALENGSIKNRLLVVMAVGPARAGKTSLLKSFNGEEFDPNEDSTNGIQQTVCKSQENGWSKDSDEGISYTECMADVICQNLRKNAEASKGPIEKSVKSSESLPKNDDDDGGGGGGQEDDDDGGGVDNDDDDDGGGGENDDDDDDHEGEDEDDQGDTTTSSKMPKPLEDKISNKLKDTADKNKEKELYIKTVDFAGQAVYNVIHPIFLTSKAVFILVYNLKNILHEPMKSKVEKDGLERELVDPFEMSNLENLELWLSCISSYTDAQKMPQVKDLSLPPVFIVGTHADEFEGNLKDAKQIIEQIHKALNPSKNPSGCHVKDKKIYTVDNSVSGNGEIRDESVIQLKVDIEKLSKSLPHMKKDIPLTWLWFEERLSKLVEKENKKYITIDEAVETAKECKVKTDAESKEFTTLLNYLHDLKSVIYFEETKLVFIDTKWLVEVFTKVIEVKPFVKRDGLHKSWDKLEEDGVLERALVEHVWKDLVDEQNTIESLLLIMEKFSLICRWRTSEGEDVYLVPAMLCNSEKREDIANVLGDERTSTMVIRFSIPHVSLGIFPRLFVAIVEEGKVIWPNLRQPKLHKNFCRIYRVGKEGKLDICIIQSSPRTISVTVCNKQKIDGQHVTEFCQHFRELLVQILDDMRRNFPWMKNMTLEYGTLCPVCARSSKECESHGKKGCTRDSCLHFINEKQLIADSPAECYKDVTALDNVIEEEAYLYWFPRQKSPQEDIERKDGSQESAQPRAKKLGVKNDDVFGRYENFALGYRHQVYVSDLKKTIKLEHSIGAIIAQNASHEKECGATCFRIGTKDVVTNLHVVDDINNFGITWDNYYVDFNYEEQGQQPADSFCFRFAPNPVLAISEELDYAILRLNPEGRILPPSVIGPETEFNIAPPGRQLQGGECLTFIGHPGGFRKQIDVSCPIKHKHEIDKHLDLARQELSESEFQKHEAQFKNPNSAIYDVSTFFKGSSGSPGFLMKDKLLVVLHRRGILYKGNIVFEEGTLMASVFEDVMLKINNGTV